MAENPAALALPPGAVAGGGGPGTGAGNTKHAPTAAQGVKVRLVTLGRKCFGFLIQLVIVSRSKGIGL